jgi:2-keto-3-deoxy-galactonokinase
MDATMITGRQGFTGSPYHPTPGGRRAPPHQL